MLYVAALLHDIEAMPGFDTGRCFEADGEHFARELLMMLGWGPSRADLVANAIATTGTARRATTTRRRSCSPRVRQST